MSIGGSRIEISAPRGRAPVCLAAVVAAAALVFSALAALAPWAALAAGAQAPAVVPGATGAPGVAGLRISLSGAGGQPLFTLAGDSVTVSGTVTPYAAGQQVQITVTRQGRTVAVQSVAESAGSSGRGVFSVRVHSRYSGLVRIEAQHAATAQQAAFAASAAPVRFLDPSVAAGSSGFSVRSLQSELAGLHYAVPLSGSFEEGTANALIAYRKMVGLERVPEAGRAVLELLRRGAGAFHVRFRSDGRHVEADLTKQVLAEIEPGGRVRAIYTTSSGKPSTPTVLGRFRVYEKTYGVNSEGMVDSNYFIRGYAIHGYAEVPTYAASHGCLRVPIPDAPAIYAWVRYGTPVDVYN